MIKSLATNQKRSAATVTDAFKVPIVSVGRYLLECTVDPSDLLDTSKSIHMAMETSKDNGKTWQYRPIGTWNGGYKITPPGKTLNPSMGGDIDQIRGLLVRAVLTPNSPITFKCELTF